MSPGPSKAAEAIVAILVPPACREEVLGDLHERYRGPGQYAFEALCTVPLVIHSRIRRTADPQVLLMQAFALYLAFLGAAWYMDPALLRGQWGLLRLAIPPGAALLGMILEDAYATPGRRSPLKLIRGPVVGLGLALFSQGVLWAGYRALALPRAILLYGCAVSFFLSSIIRMSFPPAADQLQGANAPAFWFMRAGVAVSGFPRGVTLVFKSFAAVVAALVLLFVAYQLWKRS